jgi:hypothetical protein
MIMTTPSKKFIFVLQLDFVNGILLQNKAAVNTCFLNTDVIASGYFKLEIEMNKLTEWFNQATQDQKNVLNAQFGRVSLAQLRCSEGKKHHRSASAHRAGEIEAFVSTMREADPSVPKLTRGDLCQACSDCEYWRHHA